MIKKFETKDKTFLFLSFFFQKLHGDVDKEKTAIDNIFEHANHVNPQLATLSQDLEEKRVEVRELSSDQSRVIFFSLETFTILNSVFQHFTIRN